VGRILLLATGDRMAYATRRPGFATGDDLLRTLPGAGLAAGVDVEDVFAEASWDTCPATMLAIARRVRTALADGATGVVVTHGLDTVEDTAFLTDLMLGEAAEQGTVVFTGAARPLDAAAPDGPRNLADALTAARSPALRGAGAVVCSDGGVHAARWATVLDARRPGGLSSGPHPVLARVADGSCISAAPAPARPPAPAGPPEPEVALVTTHPGFDPALLTMLVDLGSRGVVLEGAGPGNAPVDLLATIGELRDWGIPTVIASRARHATVRLEELEPPDGLAAGVGAIGSRCLPAHKARYALMCALGGGGVEECRAWFAQF
jgi:L-asparaginase